MAQAGLEFRAITSQFDESAVAADDPRDLVAQLAHGKAAAVAGQAAPGEAVIGSDTVVVCDGRVLGKPADDEDAAAMLRMLSGRTHEVLTSVCVLVDGQTACQFVEGTRVTFWALSEADIAAYVATGEPRDKAGAYGIQGKGCVLVKGIEGDYYTVVGFPISRLVRELAAIKAR